MFSASSCDRKSTPDWDTPGQAVPTVATPPTLTSPTPAPAGGDPAPSAPEAPHLPAQTPATVAPSATTEGIRFITYNVQNWLTMDRYVKGKTLKGSPKPDDEKQAVIRILSHHHPDVLGLCEIGTAADLEEIKESLRAAGLDLPNSQYIGGSDPTRHLGLLSRFPITSTAKPAESEYQLAGQTYAINRGILDATVTARGKSYRFLGVHLKSKRDSEQGDQEAIRLNEARLLRRHVDAILKADEAAPLVVYGDFNDTRSTPGLKLIFGKYNSPTYLTAIPAKDSHGEAWTHFWALHEIYSRFDFIMVSQGLRDQVDFSASSIIDDAGWNDASDHRPVMAIFK